MFWKKERPDLPKQAQILQAYLAVDTMLVGEKLLNPIARAGFQVFILGMTDMLRQVEGLSWKQFISVYEALLSENRLTPSVSIESYVQRVGEVASNYESVEKVIMQGAESIRLYVAKGDVNATTDILGAAVFAEKNESSFKMLSDIS